MDIAVVRMNNMIEGVLNYSSFHDTPQNMEVVDLNDIIKTIANYLEFRLYFPSAAEL